MDRRRAGALLALAACIACSATAPTASNHTALDLYDGAPEGCFYNFQHYGEGDRIMTNEPCLNCTCHNRMLMCYLRVCPFTKPIGQDCTIEKRADQCCPIVTCPDVPVDLLTSTSTTSPAEYGATGVGKLDKYGCSISGKNYPEGAKVPSTPNKPCEHCYCIRNMTTCVMQECTLHVDGCTPIYHKDVCCPVRYSCDHPEDEMPLLDDMSTTVRPTPGFLLTTTTISPVTQMTQDCVHDDQVFADGVQIKTEKACEHCYCMKGDIVCVVQECGTPMENEGKNCTSLPPREGQCCPDTYICEGDELATELPMDLTTESMLDSQTTLLPPRRTGVEGSGYRNEPDEVPYTDIPAIQQEHEGSGEEQVTLGPNDTTEKLDSEKPLKTDDLVSATEESLYTLPTTKSPSFEEPEDTNVNIIPGTFEPQEYIPATTNAPIETDDDMNTTEDNLIQEQVTDKQDLAPHDAISTTFASETYDKFTTEAGEALNTVPGDISGEVDIESNKHIPSPTISSAEESESTSPSITEEEMTTGGSEGKITKPEYSYPSTTTSAGQPSDTTVDLTTGKDSSETDKYIPSTPNTSMIGEIMTETPDVHESVASVDIGKENDGTEPSQYAPSTIKIPTEKDYDTTYEPDLDRHTVLEEDNSKPHLDTTTTRTSLEEVEGTTSPSMGLDSGIEDITEENILEPFDHTATASPSKVESMKTTAEPDKGLNTIPSDIIDESSSEATVLEKTTLSHETRVTDSDATRRTDSKPTDDFEYSTLASESTVSKTDHFTVTTEPSFRKEDEIGISTEKSKESETTTGKIDFTDEGFIPTLIHDEKLGTGSIGPSTEQEFTTSVPDNEVEIKSSTTEIILETSASSEKPSELPSEQETEFIFETSTTEKISDMNLAAEKESHEEPGRIPGEGDCLLNGLTYRNNSVVPNTNICHSGCKCVSSIIKCDPIICSPPPDYMDNCQSIYDSPDSCCPTYVCDHPRETVPPQSDNQMSGTESPQPTPTIECRGDQCELNFDAKHPTESSEKPENHECGPEGCVGIAPKPEDSKYPHKYPDVCKDGKCPSPADDCANGKCEVPTSHELVCDPEHGCQAVPVKPCEGEHCKETSEGAVKPPQLCENKENCKDVTPCEGDSCKFEVSSPQDTQQVPCKEEDGCKSVQVTPQECTGDSCRRNEIPDAGHNLPAECEGPLCVTEPAPEEATQHVDTEFTEQKQTPLEAVTEKLEIIEDEHKTTGSQKEPQPHIPNLQLDISTVLPEMLTVSHEIVSESESPVGSNEVETDTLEEIRTTLGESYVTESEKSSHTTDRVIIPVAENDSDGKKDISMESTEPTAIDAQTPRSDQQTTISENIGHEYTTMYFGTETTEITTSAYNMDQSEVTKLHEISSVIPTQAHDFVAQTTQASAMDESSTSESLSGTKPVSDITDVKEESSTMGAETDYKIPTHDFKIPETLVTDSEETVSKSTEPTTDEEYGFTGTPEYELPDTKLDEVEPIRIEPLEGTTEAHKSPTAEESTTRATDISEYITEREKIETKYPIEIPHITKLPQTSDDIQTESPEQYSGYTDQPISKPSVDIGSGEQPGTDASPVIKEHATEIPPPSTTETVSSFTEIDDIFVTDEDQTTTKQPTPDATISVEHSATLTELTESTTEKLHEIVQTSLPSSDKPLYPDSLSVDVTEPQEISTKATEQIVTDKAQDFDSDSEKEPSKIDVGIKHEPSSEVPSPQEPSEMDLPGTMPQSEKPEIEEKDQSTEKDAHKTSEHLPTVSEELFTKQPELDEQTTEISKSPITESHKTESPILITTAPKESSEPVIVAGQGEKTTFAPDTEDIQGHYSTEIPDMFVTEKETDTKLPETEYTKVSVITETPRTPAIQEESTQGPEEMHTELPISQITTELPISFVTDQDKNIGTTYSVPVTTKDETIEPGFTLISETTKSQGEVQTEVPIQTVPELLETITIIPEDITQTEMNISDHAEHVTKAPVDKQETEPGSIGSEEAITKPPGDIPESQPVFTGHDEVSKKPEDTKQSETETIDNEEVTTESLEKPKESMPEINRNDKTTQAPEETKKGQSDVTIEDEKSTKAPEITGVPEFEVTRRKEDSTKAPEIIEEVNPEINVQVETEVTKSPGATIGSESHVTTQEEEVTRASTDKQQETDVTGIDEKLTDVPLVTKDPLPETTGHDEMVTKTPEDTKESLPEIIIPEEEITKSPEEKQESIPVITKQEEEVTKAPGDMKESVFETTDQEVKVTKAPEDTKDTVPEITDEKTEVTEVSLDNKEELPEITRQDVTEASEYTKDPLPEVTKMSEEVTKAPKDTEEYLPEVSGTDQEVTESLPEISEQDHEGTKAPEDMKESVPIVTGQEEEVKVPEYTKESLPEITGQEQEVTKAPESLKESVPQVPGQEEEISKAPEDTKESLPETISQETEITKAPEDTKESVPQVTGQEEKVTKAPEDTKESALEIISQETEVTKAPEDTKESAPQVTGQKEEVTKAPEDTKESAPEIISQETEVTKAPEDTKVSVPQVTGQEEEVTKAPGDTRESAPEIINQETEVTKTPEDTKESVPQVTSQEEEVTNAPEDTKESAPETITHEVEVTKAPGDTDESVPEMTEQDQEVTRVPEVMKETVPEIIREEEEVTKAPEDTKEKVPEITEQEKEVTKAPEDTKESVPDMIGQEQEVNKAPEDTKASEPEITGHEEEVTKAPEDTKESEPDMIGQEQEVNKAPEDTKESVTDMIGHEETITEAPEHTKQTVPEITGQEEKVTKAPEDTKESVPDMIGHEEAITEAPEVTKETVPEITGQEEEVTKGPEDTKESVPDIIGNEEAITKAPEDTKETVPEITEQEEEVTKAPKDTKESVPEMIGQEQEVTQAPEDINKSVPEVTGLEQEVTRAPEDTKESVPEMTGQEQEVTRAPEDTKESLPEITGHEEEVSKAPVDKQELVPGIIGQEQEVTKSPEDKKELVSETTGHETEVTKAPEDKIDTVPEITGQDEQVTKTPESTKESMPEITEQEQEVTKAPDVTKELVPEITRQREEITEAPLHTKESENEITGQPAEVTEAPEDSRPEIPSKEEKVTKTPEDVKELEPVVTELSPADIITEKQETTPTLLEIHEPHEGATESSATADKVLEDTTVKQVEEPATEQPTATDQFSETTPDVIILEEHTHKMIEESSTISPSFGEQTTVFASESPISELTSQTPTEGHTEPVLKEDEKTTKADEELITSPTMAPTTLPSFAQITEKDSESSLPTAITSSDHKIDETLHEKEPSSAPATEKPTPAAHIDTEKSSTPDTELPVQTEKIPLLTEKPVHHEIADISTAEDELVMTTPIATTVKQQEVTAMADDKLTKPEEKPVESSEVTPSAIIPESQKPSETQPTDELPAPEEDTHFPSSMNGYGEPEDYGEEDQVFGPGTCRYGGKVYVSAQQIPRDDPCDFCFCFRSDIICLQQSCPPPIHGCHEEPIQGFCCPRYECPVSMATTINMTTTTTTTTTTLPPHFPTHSYKGAAQRRGCQIKGHTYKVGEVVRSSSGPCLHCTCGGDGQMKCDPKACTPEPMLRQMIAAAVSAKRRR